MCERYSRSINNWTDKGPIRSDNCLCATLTANNVFHTMPLHICYWTKCFFFFFFFSFFFLVHHLCPLLSCRLILFSISCFIPGRSISPLSWHSSFRHGEIKVNSLFFSVICRFFSFFFCCCFVLLTV